MNENLFHFLTSHWAFLSLLLVRKFIFFPLDIVYHVSAIPRKMAAYDLNMTRCPLVLFQQKYCL